LSKGFVHALQGRISMDTILIMQASKAGAVAAIVTHPIDLDIAPNYCQ